MNYFKSILFASILMLGLVAGVITQNNLFAVFSLVITALAILIPFALVIGVVEGIQIFINRQVSYLLVACCASVLSLIVLLATGSLINRWKINAVEAYVSHAAPILDQIKARTGTYPSNLPTDIVGKPPSLLRDAGPYTASPQSFRFEYVDEPAGWAGDKGALKFESSRREWVSDR